MDEKELTERLHAVEVAQATGDAALAGAQATQAAAMAGAEATQAAAAAGAVGTSAAMQAGTVGMMAVGGVSLVVGIFLGSAIRGSRR